MKFKQHSYAEDSRAAFTLRAFQVLKLSNVRQHGIFSENNTALNHELLMTVNKLKELVDPVSVIGVSPLLILYAIKNLYCV